MDNYYRILGVNSSATQEELRRAYRILARRYHPDVNPGKSSEERFKSISLAYDTLNDPDKRRQYDSEFEANSRTKTSTAEDAYRRAASAAAHTEARRRAKESAERSRAQAGKQHQQEAQPRKSRRVTENTLALDSFVSEWKGKLSRLRDSGLSAYKKFRTSSETKKAGLKVSVVEVSVTTHDALYGGKKAIEIAEPEGVRKVSIRVPAGTRSGAVLRLRSNQAPNEDLVVILRVATHPYVSIQNKGVVIEIPVSLSEVTFGASIAVPSLEEQLLLKIPAGSQGGQELRVQNKGIAQRDGTRGDLFYRLIVKVPESPDAIGLKEKITELEKYYGNQIRRELPKSLSEIG